VTGTGQKSYGPNLVTNQGGILVPAITFAVPIAPGKTEHWKKAISEIKGARSEGHAASRKRAGFTRELVCLQATPMGDFVVVMIEGADPLSSLQKMVESKEPFDQWFGMTVRTYIQISVCQDQATMR